MLRFSLYPLTQLLTMFMGEFRFRTPTDWQLPTEVAATIHVVGLDGIPWPCKIHYEDTTLAVSRNREESGRTFIGYQSAKYGRLMLCTGSLLANEDYDLLIELARGTLNRVRHQISNWDEGGLQIAAHVHDRIRKATQKLGSALMSNNVGQRDDLSQEAIDLTLGAIFELSYSFGRQIASYRREHPEVEKFWMACTAPSVEDGSVSCDVFSTEPFDRVRVLPEQLIDVGDIAESNSLVVGPFLDASAGGMRRELVECDDFRARRLRLLNSMRGTLSSLPSSATLLHLVSGINGLGHRHLNYAQQLQIAMDMLNVVDELSLQMPTMVSFDFPWAERLAGSVGGIHPLQVADSLLRQGVRVSYLGLEMNLDYGVTGSAFRDPLQWIELIDIWAQLGLPIVLCLRMPSMVPSDWGLTDDSRLVNLPGEGMLDEQRLAILETVLPMMAARPTVAGLLWQQWADDSDRRFPYGGIVTSDQVEKPVVKLLQELRNRI